MPAAYYIVSILVSLCGCMFFYLTPLGILTAGLWSRDRNWWIHFAIALILATFIPQFLGIIAGIKYKGSLISASLVVKKTYFYDDPKYDVVTRHNQEAFAHSFAPFGFLYSVLNLIVEKELPKLPLFFAFIINFLGFVYAVIYIILSGRSASAYQSPVGGLSAPPSGYPAAPEYPEYPTSPPPPPRP